ncbi:hypothetical protein FA15DRAFT_662746 [Coprinopsis marcescibilis]|uniref:BAG domain-containing protein n=1 Tax=Coprinopsis marcescibilis TaxID=230819 RepID=A0A5C3LCB8_COPMA|nr:hypothetical protein FA15DRAFT_662746 [Coprinopsis marcescibilis]
MYHSQISQQQYLTALADARAAEAAARAAEAEYLAAEAEYLAAEAARQEELALKARLYDLEQRKKYSRPAYRVPEASYPASLISTYDYPAVARQYDSSVYPNHLHSHRPVAGPLGLAVSPRTFSSRSRAEELEAHLSAERAARIAAQEELKRVTALQSTERQNAKEPQLVWPHQAATQWVAPRKFAAQQPVQHCPFSTSTAWPQAGPADRSGSPKVSLNELLGAAFAAPSNLSGPAQVQAPATSKGKLTQPASTKPSGSNASKGSLLEQLQARTEASKPHSVHDAVRFVIDALSNPPHPTPTANNPNEGLINQLLARFQAEQDDEVRDTIQATIDSLLSQGAPSPSAAPSSPSSSKGKEKALPVPSPSVASSLSRVEHAESTFRRLEAEFEFPTQLDFVSTTTSVDDTPALSLLSFTARNHPVRYYEQNLLALLTDLDLIESMGHPELRKRRKETVALIEMALETLEQEISGRWKSKVAKEQANTSGSPDASTATHGNQPEPAVEDETPRQEDEESVATNSPPTFAIPIVESDFESTPEAVVSDSLLEEVTCATNDEEPVSFQPTADPELQSTSATCSPESIADLEDDSNSPSDSQITIKPEEVTQAAVSQDRGLADITFKVPIKPTVSPFDALQQTVTEVERPDSPFGSSASNFTATSNGSQEAFLLTDQPESLESRQPPKRKTYVEDLGSDWSDLDA